MTAEEKDVIGDEHWTDKNDEVRLFLWEKYVGSPHNKKGTILFVHGSSMASQPTFDLHVEGRPFSSAMNYFAVQGYDTWCVDMEGYGKSTKTRDITCDISNGADDLAALFAERHPERVARLALDAFVWTGEGSPTLEDRRKKLPQFLESKRRPIDKAFVQSIFSRDHPGCAEDKVVEAFAEAICALDDSMPNGTYIDMCSKLPLVDPEKITVPTIVMRGEYDGIAGMGDLLKFFDKLANTDKQFTMMQGISHASFQQKNYMLVYHILDSFFRQPTPVYKGE